MFRLRLRNLNLRRPIELFNLLTPLSEQKSPYFAGYDSDSGSEQNVPTAPRKCARSGFGSASASLYQMDVIASSVPIEHHANVKRWELKLSDYIGFIICLGTYLPIAYNVFFIPVLFHDCFVC